VVAQSPSSKKLADTAAAPSFEDSLARIEEIVTRLEGGDLSLDESLLLFQEGVELSRRCQTSLDAAQKKIEQLVRSADGALGLQPLEGLVPDPDQSRAAGPNSQDDGR
jgi:exodeoxyribonuclease VII small subunit